MADSSEAHLSFEYKGLELAYHRFGSGPRIFLAFHGYGQLGSVFRNLPDESMTVYAVDLPFHGNSKGAAMDEKVEKGLSPSDFIAWTRAFLDEQHIANCTLTGYSMGGRMVLCLCQGLLDRVDGVQLIAPDGFNPSLSYRLSTSTNLGRAVFKRLPSYHGLIQIIARASRVLGFIDQRLYRLVNNHTADKPKSEQLYKTWTYLRYLQPDLKSLALDLALESIDLIVHLGDYDTIIHKDNVLKWSYLDQSTGRTRLHGLGHRLLVEEVFEELRVYAINPIESQ